MIRSPVHSRLSATVLIGALSAACPTLAQQPRTTDTRVTSSQMQASLSTRPDESAARAWGLRPEEWARYGELMQGPLGVTAPNLDPLTALGIEARSGAERQHYAELQVQFESQRVQKELIYQQAYDAAWKRLYPALQPVNLASAGPFTAIAATAAHGEAGRLAVFVKADCPACDARVQQLQSAGAAFDVYLVGSRQDDALVRVWAKHAGIDPAKVRTHTVTLNHDAGRWLSIGGQGELPAVVQEVGGQWRRQ
ncbi:TIGR03759 family integrating conjugative element protein [Paraburkholderia ginsengisoli]|uniref:TIGR03759 family integrating conjugative element protein n=1 Tax=Paraburkholderia ginsengisoli TaxID=311231 RepID=A0A7T4N327_9BURK|nr:TIGR03759 family integrating conjugative element protein [Paraburkholderia ginsengisoli]QQC64358.1 TIGR03759 family integrating conjugative element protein [Paraburkholderia ginsengisoli]